MTLADLTRSIRADGGKALVPFFTAGYPDTETSLRLVTSASRLGCPVIEIGVPFSDPIADGPLIQESSRRALENGMTLRKALALAERASASVSAALVVMSYVNPIFRMGIECFAEHARASGVSGVILPDVPIEESEDIRRLLAERGIALIDLVAPTSSETRIKRITACASGFLYLVSLTGVTGVRSALAADLESFIGRVRKESDLPLYVGFGVSTPDQARDVASRADGVIVGSALIRIIRSAKTGEEAVIGVERFLKQMNQAVQAPKRRSS